MGALLEWWRRPPFSSLMANLDAEKKKPSPDLHAYCFAPQEDITAFELAKIFMSIKGGYMADFGLLYFDPDNLPEESIMRHWRRSPEYDRFPDEIRKMVRG